MVLLRFTKLLDKVRDHRKTQTMRKPRKRSFKAGDRLDIYVLERLGTATLNSVKRKPLKNITLEEALKDGFDSIEQCQSALMKMHKCDLDQEFDILEFEPHWPAHTITLSGDTTFSFPNHRRDVRFFLQEEEV